MRTNAGDPPADRSWALDRAGVLKAIKQAIRSDMIVLAAAGNCVGLVVFPARCDEVVAVAESNVDDGTWRGSCHGDAVDITAPAEKVWKAIARPGGTDLGGGQGVAKARRSRWQSPQGWPRCGCRTTAGRR